MTSIANAVKRHPASLSAALCFLVMGTLFWSTGTLWPTGPLPAYATSSRQITGMAITLTILPAYLLAASFIMRRRSLALIDSLEPALPDRAIAEEARSAVSASLARSWRPGAAVGLVMGLLNTQPLQAVSHPETIEIELSISVGQLVLWLLAGLLLGQRVLAARAFSRLGEEVRFDLFQLDRLRPLARSGTIDVLVIAGALVLSPLQALDAEFRWYNYSFGLLIALPAALFLFSWPLRTVHARVLAEKGRQLARVEARLDEVDRDRGEAALTRLEMLLAHRERLLGQSSWPVSTGLISRVLFYLVIPPLAWAGAAIVEMIVNRMVG